jgi:hypothetical protein
MGNCLKKNSDDSDTEDDYSSDNDDLVSVNNSSTQNDEQHNNSLSENREMNRPTKTERRSRARYDSLYPHSLSNATFSGSISSLATIHTINNLLSSNNAQSPSLNNVYCGLSNSFNSSTFNKLNEEEQIMIIKRATIIEQLPTTAYSPTQKNKE